MCIKPGLSGAKNVRNGSGEELMVVDVENKNSCVGNGSDQVLPQVHLKLLIIAPIPKLERLTITRINLKYPRNTSHTNVHPHMHIHTHLG